MKYIPYILSAPNIQEHRWEEVSELTYNIYVPKEKKDCALVDGGDLYNPTEEPNLPQSSPR